jgi:hypothetical protein
MLPVSLDCQFFIAHSVILGHMLTFEIIYAFVVVSVLSIYIYISSVSKYDCYISKYCVKLDLLYISENVCMLFTTSTN